MGLGGKLESLRTTWWVVGIGLGLGFGMGGEGIKSLMGTGHGWCGGCGRSKIISRNVLCWGFGWDLGVGVKASWTESHGWDARFLGKLNQLRSCSWCGVDPTLALDCKVDWIERLMVEMGRGLSS